MSAFSYFDEKPTLEERLREAWENAVVSAMKTMWEAEFVSVARQHAEHIKEKEHARKRQELAELVGWAVMEAYGYIARKNYPKAEERLREAERVGKGFFSKTTEPIASAWQDLYDNKAIDLLQTNSFEEVLLLPKLSPTETHKMHYARAMANLQLGRLPAARSHILSANHISPGNAQILTGAAHIETAIALVAADQCQEYRNAGERDRRVLGASMDRLRESQRFAVGYCAGAITAGGDEPKVFANISRTYEQLKTTEAVAKLNTAALQAAGFFEPRVNARARTRGGIVEARR